MSVAIINKNSLGVAYNNLYNQVSFVKDNDFDSRGVRDIIYSAQREILVLCKLGNMWVRIPVIDSIFIIFGSIFNVLLGFVEEDIFCSLRLLIFFE